MPAHAAAPNMPAPPNATPNTKGNALDSSDGWVEAAIETDRPVVAVMWHPEREDPIRDLDRQLVRRVFAYDTAAS